MANPLCDVVLTDDALRWQPWQHDSKAGALVEFRGLVRGLEEDREIEGIDYEVHAVMAEHQMRSIAHSAVEKFGLRHVVMHHRTGFVAAGEPSLYLRAAAPHRGAAFAAAEWMVHELKRSVPIWKRPRFKSRSGEVEAAMSPLTRTAPVQPSTMGT